jgi:hypothetical protein
MRYSALICCVAGALLFAPVSQADEPGSNKNPLSFGDDQTIVDLDKIVWGPLEVEGLAPGAEIATIRGDLAKDHSESVVRLPPGYVLRNHTHTSDELYIWISGSFTLIAHDGTAAKFRGPAYISYPGNAPPHEIKCGSTEPCLFYLRYSRPFDIKY